MFYRLIISILFLSILSCSDREDEPIVITDSFSKKQIDSIISNMNKYLDKDDFLDLPIILEDSDSSYHFVNLHFLDNYLFAMYEEIGNNSIFEAIEFKLLNDNRILYFKRNVKNMNNNDNIELANHSTYFLNNEKIIDTFKGDSNYLLKKEDILQRFIELKRYEKIN